MRWLYTLLYLYIGGLMLFYLVAVFDTYVWDIVYFGWSKICDASVLAWLVIYHLVKPSIYQLLVRPILVFSFIRAGWDVVSFFTGVGVNNSVVVALLFLGVLSAITYVEVIQQRKINKYLQSKKK